MSETKFTKGPWVLLPEEVDRAYIRVRGDLPGTRFKIANVLTPIYENVHEREAKETRANANLIVAAPDLYEANVFAIEHIGKWLSAALDDDGVCTEFKGEILQWMELSSYAERKARGEL